MSSISESNEDLVVVNKLTKVFPFRSTFFGETKYVHAVDGISFHIQSKRILGLVGESGCGKTTTANLVLRLLEPTSGDVLFGGRSVFTLSKSELKDYRRNAQLIFQDPYASLNPTKDVWHHISRPLIIHRLTDSRQETLDRVYSLLETVGLTPVTEYVHKYPHELSGGERQRVGIARVLAVSPNFIVADEPVSMIDMSLRASILKLLLRLRDEMNLTYLYITHDLASARYLCDNIAVMYLGKIMEIGETEKVLTDPLHPYTKLLISAIPVPNPKLVVKHLDIHGGIPDPTDIPLGCRFQPRCPIAKAACRDSEPQLMETEKNRRVRCFP